MKPPLQDWTIGRDLERDALPGDLADFLRTLGAPTLIRLAGRDGSRTRVVTTLLHANEPSGVRAVLRYLRGGHRPATDVVFFVGAVQTALTEPFMSHRAIPGEPDANRVWTPPFDTPQGEVAKQVLDRLRALRPEFLVDLHNNTGHNPAYGVAFGLGAPELSLVSLFADRVVHTPIELRALVEATHDDFPSVTVECGRAGDAVADEAAWVGLQRFLDLDEIDPSVPHRPMHILGSPVRVCIEPGLELAFADRIDREVSLTISKNIDRHNFERLAAGSPIGWLAHDESRQAWPLNAIGGAGEECSRALFEVDGGVLRTRRDFIPIMMTTNREIAQSDCLFYAVQRMEVGSLGATSDFYLSKAPPGTAGAHPEARAWWR